MLFNAAGEEFPAQCAVLFERRAENYLDMECLTMAGILLFGYLKAAVTKSPDRPAGLPAICPLRWHLQLPNTLSATRLFPIQKSLLPFQFADPGDVLADLKASPVVSAGIAHRKVADVDEFAAQLNPEFGRIP
jgi:hypothetical protein